MLREDFLIRMIQQIGDFLARIAGHERALEFDEAEDEARHAWDDVLGVPRALVEVTDTPTLAGLLHDPAKMRAAARLLAAEARVVRRRGDPPGATMLMSRAFELALEARAIEPDAAEDVLVTELAREVTPSMIDARYR